MDLPIQTLLISVNAAVDDLGATAEAMAAAIKSGDSEAFQKATDRARRLKDHLEAHAAAIKLLQSANRQATADEAAKTEAAGGLNAVQRSVAKLDEFRTTNAAKIAALIEGGHLIRRSDLPTIEADHYVRHLFDGLYIVTGRKVQHSPDLQQFLDSIPA